MQDFLAGLFLAGAFLIRPYHLTTNRDVSYVTRQYFFQSLSSFGCGLASADPKGAINLRNLVQQAWSPDHPGTIPALQTIPSLGDLAKEWLAVLRDVGVKWPAQLQYEDGEKFLQAWRASTLQLVSDGSGWTEIQIDCLSQSETQNSQILLKTFVKLLEQRTLLTRERAKLDKNTYKTFLTLTFLHELFKSYQIQIENSDSKEGSGTSDSKGNASLPTFNQLSESWNSVMRKHASCLKLTQFNDYDRPEWLNQWLKDPWDAETRWFKPLPQDANKEANKEAKNCRKEAKNCRNPPSSGWSGWPGWPGWQLWLRRHVVLPLALLYDNHNVAVKLISAAMTVITFKFLYEKSSEGSIRLVSLTRIVFPGSLLHQPLVDQQDGMVDLLLELQGLLASTWNIFKGFVKPKCLSDVYYTGN